MNHTNIKALRDTLANISSDSFDITMWQSPNIVVDIQEMHTCGNTACIAGWIALMPEFKRDSGYVTGDGRPKLPGQDPGVPSVAHWLGIDLVLATSICAGYWWFHNQDHINSALEAHYSDIVCNARVAQASGKLLWEDIDREAALSILDALLDGSLSDQFL